MRGNLNMSIWASIPGTYALHYKNSATDPRTAKRLPGLFPGEFGDEVDLAVVPDHVFNDGIGEGYLPYLRLGLIVNNTAQGDVILNRVQVKKLNKELKKFLKNTKKPKEIKEEKKFSICDFIWNYGANSCTLESGHEGDHVCCCGIRSFK